MHDCILGQQQLFYQSPSIIINNFLITLIPAHHFPVCAIHYAFRWHYPTYLYIAFMVESLVRSSSCINQLNMNGNGNTLYIITYVYHQKLSVLGFRVLPLCHSLLLFLQVRWHVVKLLLLQLLIIWDSWPDVWSGDHETIQ